MYLFVLTDVLGTAGQLGRLVVEQFGQSCRLVKFLIVHDLKKQERLSASKPCTVLTIFWVHLWTCFSLPSPQTHPRRFRVAVSTSDFEYHNLGLSLVAAQHFCACTPRFFGETLLPAYTRMNEHAGADLHQLWLQLKLLGWSEFPCWGLQDYCLLPLKPNCQGQLPLESQGSKEPKPKH